jgi:hypothetical protein
MILSHPFFDSPTDGLEDRHSVAPIVRSSGSRSRGITLVEMLVALAVTLMMMGAVITVFGFIGERVTDSRGIIETNQRLRSAAHRLREDLSSITVEAIPWQRPESGQGYLEILEGPLRDAYDASGNINLLPGGDTDDVLMFTVRSEGDPYRGKFGTSFIESNTAEVVWYVRTTAGVITNPPTYTLCRRQFLIVPQAPLTVEKARPDTFFDFYDVSARITGPKRGDVVANTLGDLTKRENRFKHGPALLNPQAYPFRVNIDTAATGIRSSFPPGHAREGEEVVLANVLSFNVQVFDPGVVIRANGSAAFEPGDPGYRNTSAAGAGQARGAYMDLGDPVLGSIFGAIDPVAGVKSRLAPSNNYSTYDTWSFHYEHDGIRQPGATIPDLVDAGTNGLDDNPGDPTTVGVDDMSERETSPPYPYPLRGLRVKIRVYEPGSKQVREVTVAHSFVPE